MATPLPMPKLGLTMEEGTILKWIKSEGEEVEKGEMILQIQTDKVEYEVESPDGGILLKTFAAEGDVVPCGDNIAVIGAEGEDTGAFQNAAAEPVAPAPAPTSEPVTPEPAAPEPVAPPAVQPATGRVLASPAARRVARELGVDYRTLRGSGPGGRIVQADVQAAVDSGAPRSMPAAPPAAQTGPPAVASAAPVAGMRKVIVERMAASWDQVPRITLQAEVDLTNLLAVREASKAAWESDLGVKISINDLIVFYTARAVRRFPQVNVQLSGGEICRMQDVNIGLAVAVEEGLMVPVIRGADQKSIDQISRESRQLAEAARAGGLPLTALEGGTFTVSNLGAYGVDHFSAIINAPESAILTVGAARERAVVRGGEVVPRTTCFIGINADHRIVDGAPAAEFLGALKNTLEHPKVIPA
ncbi:MAG: dihydrolipoamide acetyltransferase family protein [Nitrospinota bacterium]|nr:dihydrolipoamide acetyltransferase family protein [Nitrospinota bacterium]MDP7370890.1 dihydrolipoamide acetyltransferase family protein [Nitrospinota bacterium]HJP14989.1 dihydrolipoamide acetyltransferase family protein [Nitrospinota bacterium]